MKTPNGLYTVMSLLLSSSLAMNIKCCHG